MVMPEVLDWFEARLIVTPNRRWFACRSMQASHLVSRFTVWDYVVFGGMLCVSAAIGIYYAVMGVRKKATTDDFLMGGRSMSVFPVALSILASFMSAITLLGTASEMYIYGTQYLFIIFSYCLVIPATAYLYMPIFYSLHVTSAYEVSRVHFYIRIVYTSRGSAVCSLLSLSCVMYGKSHYRLLIRKFPCT